MSNTKGETAVSDKREDSRTHIEVDLASAVAMLFFLFWLQSGWYRVDCALGTSAACDLIAAEYKAKVTP